MKHAFILTLAALLGIKPTVLSAQVVAPSHPMQVCVLMAPVGVGWPSPSTQTLYASHVAVSMGKNGHWFTVAATYLGMLDLSFDIHAPSGPDDQYWDLGILYGRRLTEGEDAFLLAEIGIAQAHYHATHARRNPSGWGEYAEHEEFTVWSVPVDVQLVAMASDHFGFVLNVFENLNVRRCFGGMALGLNVKIGAKASSP
jgi:hypothetical protein